MVVLKWVFVLVLSGIWNSFVYDECKHRFGLSVCGETKKLRLVLTKLEINNSIFCLNYLVYSSSFYYFFKE